MSNAIIDSLVKLAEECIGNEGSLRRVDSSCFANCYTQSFCEHQSGFVEVPNKKVPLLKDNYHRCMYEKKE